MEQTKLYVVIPCYNEEQVLPITSKLFLEELKDLIQKGKISEDSRILFVNDGSKDRTWEIITQLSQQDEHFEGISQSRNRGHQNAVLAGLMEAKDLADITISIDSFFKRFTAESFYKLLNGMGVESVYNHSDYRLVSSKVLQELPISRKSICSSEVCSLWWALKAPASTMSAMSAWQENPTTLCRKCWRLPLMELRA